jgi:ATP-binding cassette subfamily B protein
MTQRREFTAEGAHQYDQRGPLRWIVSHILRYRRLALVVVLCFITGWVCHTQVPVQYGRLVTDLAHAGAAPALAQVALTVLGLFLLDGVSFLVGNFAAENIATRFQADAREELYISLLGKSQSFHDRQRVGDIMARATDDAAQLSGMVVPGMTLVFEIILGLTIPIATIASVRAELLLAPVGFVACYVLAARRYTRRLGPVMQQQREQFGAMNAGLEETVVGIETVQAAGREDFERDKFRRSARRFHDLFVQQGLIEARYLPLLLYGVALGLTFLHTLLLYAAGSLSIGEIITVMALVHVLRVPTFISVFALSQLGAGVASARRILELIRAETDLDQNSGGFSRAVSGAITFENVSFGYDGGPVLQDVSFQANPGETIALVGLTGAGKSTLTRLVNRTYDVSAGRVLIDGVDVRDWDLDSLRGQIATIEQDVFLFTRSLAENIAFGAPGAARPQVEAAARSAQAHDFIARLPDGYDTLVGERGATLSGGQRQRIALARALLSEPRILILDDSTSAVDSATEDQIQEAIRQIQQGRTTLLITHRLAQIRRADRILVLDRGRLAAQGDHETLLRTSPHYRRIFAHYELSPPPSDQAGAAGTPAAAEPRGAPWAS